MPRANRRIRRRPSTDLNIREKIVDQILASLYTPHWKYWYTKLSALIAENKEFHGREGNPRTFGIHYAGKAWFTPYAGRPDANHYSILPLHPDYPAMEKIAVKITAGLGLLDVEFYEVKRFLVGFLQFPAPMSVVEDKLGSALFGRIGRHIRNLETENQQHIWNNCTRTSFDDYLEEYDYLIKSMCQRVMMNLIAQDAFRER